MSNRLTKPDEAERQQRLALRAIEKKAEEDKYRAYLDEHHERVRQNCGNEAIFEQCTWWCKNQAAIWLESEITRDRRPESAVPAERDWPGWTSVMFVRDTVMAMFRGNEYHMYPPGYDYDDQVGGQIPELFVVGEHTSKSIRLPVMQFQWNNMLVTTRYNYHDWKVSIRLPECLDLEKDLLDIVDGSDYLLHPVYFEGFPDAYIFPPLSANDYPITAQFSVMFGHQYPMWTFFWLLKRWYDGRFGPTDPTG